MDNGAVSFGGLAPGEDGDTGGAGAPAENVREGASEAVREAAREAAMNRIKEGAGRIQAIRAVEVKKGKREGAVASGLGKAVKDPRIAGDFLRVVVNRATERAGMIRADAVQELDAVDPLPVEALQFLGITPGSGSAPTNSTYEEEGDADDDAYHLAA